MISAKENNGQISSGQLLLLFFPLYAIILLWFGHFQTNVIYGDDLAIFQSFRSTSNLEIIQQSQKYRPVNVLLVRLLMATLGKHISLYYYFNAAMQAICALIFIKTANLFLKNTLFAFLFGVLVAVSRFNFYNLTQLYNGGAMEVPAMMFFMGSVYYWVKTTFSENTEKQNFRYLLLAILLGNLSIYTHERYLVIFPFMLFALIFPSINHVKTTHKLIAAVLMIASMAGNYIIKEQILHISFFMGTGNTHIALSPTSICRFFIEAVASIFQVNIGPEYLVGLPYQWMSAFYKTLPMFTAMFMFLALGVYVSVSTRHKEQFVGNKNSGLVVFMLCGLLVLTLGSAIVTIRLEQRWLQAAFALLMLVTAACIGSVAYNKTVSGIAISFFVTIFLFSEKHYVDEGSRNIYLSNSVRKAAIYKRALDNDVIMPSVQHILILDTKSSVDDKNEVQWILQNGAFFDFYGKGAKTVQFIDSLFYQNTLSGSTTLPALSQIIAMRNDTFYSTYTAVSGQTGK